MKDFDFSATILPKSARKENASSTWSAYFTFYVICLNLKLTNKTNIVMICYCARIFRAS